MKKWLLFLGLLAGSQVSAQISSDIIFRGGDWENGITGNGMFRTLQAGEPWSFTRVTSPVRQGKYSARIELRYGDTAGSSGTSRAEAAHALSLSGQALVPKNGETTYHAFSVMVEKNWVPPLEHGLLMQVHTELGNPPFAFGLMDKFRIVLNGGNTCSAANFKILNFSDSSLNAGQWVDFLFRVKWSNTNTGQVQVWRRNQNESTFREVLNASGVANLKSCVSTHYMKHGFYRGKSTPHTNVLWVDGFTWGKTRDAVASHAFGSVPLAPAVLKVEAESAVLAAPMSVVDMVGASGGKLVQTSVSEQGSATYTLNIPQTGNYSLEAMVLAPGSGMNSVYVRFDNLAETIWHLPVSTSLRTVKYGDCDYTGMNCQPRTVYLTKGLHRLVISGREKETGIDALILRQIVN